jgi:predicted enzyme related to lactoylglutathione lyase
MARALRDALAAKDVMLSYSEALELISRTFDFPDWNTFAARATDAAAPAERGESGAIQVAVPILRMLDVKTAKAFYVDLLGFKIEWEHRFAPDYPLYMQVVRAGLRLHLSEHNGDATPGSAVYIQVQGLDRLQTELRAKGSHVGIEEGPGESRRLQIHDPFGNRLRFAERRADASSAPKGYSFGT